MTIEVNGISLYTRQLGSGPLVVVLHGGPGAHHDYLLPQYDLLAKGRELFYYDQRGGGQSPVPRETPVGGRGRNCGPRGCATNGEPSSSPSPATSATSGTPRTSRPSGSPLAPSKPSG